MRIALLCPHIFMQNSFISDVIFSPGHLAISLADGLSKTGHQVTIFSPGKLTLPQSIKNITSDITLIENELKRMNISFGELMRIYPLTYITLARQIQAELISKCYALANSNSYDLVHVWMNEEDTALEFSRFCIKPVVFTHHEPLNFLTRYRTSFEKYKDLNWISISYAQRKTAPEDMNWIGNVYHGVEVPADLNLKTKRPYFAYLGRIIEPKGVHLAIKAVKQFNEIRRKENKEIIPLRIAGKHYSNESKDSYWTNVIKPEIDDNEIIYHGFISEEREKFEFLGNAKALLAPSIWDEPFGMMTIEASAVGTPTIGLDNGALPEIIDDGKNGFIVKTIWENGKFGKKINLDQTISNVVKAMSQIEELNTNDVHSKFSKEFTIVRMCKEYGDIYSNFENLVV